MCLWSIHIAAIKGVKPCPLCNSGKLEYRDLADSLEEVD